MSSNSEAEINENQLSTKADDTNINKSPSRTTGQSVIGAKLVKKLETLAANSKENKDSTQSTNNETSTTTTNEPELPFNANRVAKNLISNLTDSDTQKKLLTLATQLAELQEQTRGTQSKINESEKRSLAVMRERDQVLMENNRMTAAKVKLETLCRDLHRHNQQIRDESVQRQQDDETKRRELATKFQTTIDEITSQLSNYSEKSASLRSRNAELSEQLSTVINDCQARQKEFEAALKQKELELRLTSTSLEQSHALLNERTDLIKKERQVSEAERLVLYKKCEELAASELSLRSQVTVYAERYQEFQNAIQQSSQMVTSCQTEIEKMGKKIESLEKERNDYRQQWETTEKNQRKLNDDMKVLEKEKRQLDIKVDKLDRLCRTLQQERTDLKTTIKNLTKSNDSTTSTTVKTDDSTSCMISDTDKSPNLYDSELGRIAKTVD